MIKGMTFRIDNSNADDIKNDLLTFANIINNFKRLTRVDDDAESILVSFDERDVSGGFEITCTDPNITTKNSAWRIISSVHGRGNIITFAVDADFARFVISGKTWKEWNDDKGID